MEIILLIVALFTALLFLVSKFAKKACAWCGKLDFLSDEKLCRSCTVISKEVKKRRKLVRESYEIIKKSQKLEIQLSRIKLIFDQLNALKKHYDQGVHFTTFSLETYYKEAEIMRNKILSQMAEKVIGDAKIRADTLNDPQQKLKAYAEARQEIRNLDSLSQEDSVLDQADLKLREIALKTEFAMYLEEASKIEFRGDKEKALEKYYDALYFFHKKWPENTKEKKIIEEKIIELGGTLNKTYTTPLTPQSPRQLPTI